MAKKKKWPSGKMVKFVFQMAKWINCQMQWVAKCKNDRICPQSVESWKEFVKKLAESKKPIT